MRHLEKGIAVGVLPVVGEPDIPEQICQKHIFRKEEHSESSIPQDFSDERTYAALVIPKMLFRIIQILSGSRRVTG